MHAFTGLMSWVSLVLQEALSKWKHLCGSTDSFLKRITSFKMDEDDVIMHMDLKDFFMTGTAEFLTHHASLLVRLRFRKVFRSVLMCLLNNQLITSSVIPNDFWKVVVGSGMRLRCSPELADAAFLHACD